jgi:putative DNA primase/helicase
VSNARYPALPIPHNMPVVGVDPKNPRETAASVVANIYPNLRHYQDVFYRWVGTHYSPVRSGDLVSNIYALLAKATVQVGNKGLEDRFKPDDRAVGKVIHALRGLVQLSDDAGTSPPLWTVWNGIARHTGAPADIIACKNGLLNVRTRTLHPHTPFYFNTASLPFDYDANAWPPRQWLQFLHSLWQDDQESIACLQELFGLLLTPDTSHQKLFLLLGMKRGGKGTIGRIMQRLLGCDHVCAPTLESLGGRFGLHPLVGKSLAVIGDADSAGKTTSSTVERLKGISGEDTFDVDRKNREVIPAYRFPTRIVMLANQVPRLADSSAAMADRFIVWKMTVSFLGREDHDLERKLGLELPAILVWSLIGLDRLRKRGRFVQPESARQDVELLQDIGSPIGAFIREACVVGPDQSVPCGTLFYQWQRWCSEQGRTRTVGTVQTFASHLYAALPKVTTRRPRRDDGNRNREYVGVGLTPDRAADSMTTAISALATS